MIRLPRPWSFPICRHAGRKTDYVKCRQWTATHSIDIRQGIGAGNLAESIRIVNNRRKKVHRLNQRLCFAYFIYPGVVGLVETDQQVRVITEVQALQHRVQNLWTEFGSSTGTGDFGCQSDLYFVFIVTHRFHYITNDSLAQDIPASPAVVFHII